MSYPNDRRYTKEHEWAKAEGNTVTIGITDHAQSALGDVVYLELPEAGRELGKGEPFGVVESIKAVSDLYAPVAGEVLEANEPLKDEPAKINSNPHDDAWLVKLKVADAAAAMSDLMDAKAYEDYVKTL